MKDEEFNWFTTNKQTRRKSSGIFCSKRYQGKIPISAAKKKDLMVLCRLGIIPREYHEYYACLITNKDKTDRLDEPDTLEESDVDN